MSQYGQCENKWAQKGPRIPSGTSWRNVGKRQEYTVGVIYQKISKLPKVALLEEASQPSQWPALLVAAQRPQRAAGLGGPPRGALELAEPGIKGPLSHGVQEGKKALRIRDAKRGSGGSSEPLNTLPLSPCTEHALLVGWPQHRRDVV